MERYKHVRNVAIILLIALAIDVVPGGGRFSDTVQQTLYLTFFGVLAWAASRMYREHRVAIYGLGDRRRATVYTALGVLAVTLTATDRMWDSTVGEFGWLLLIAGSVFLLVETLRAARSY
jgi:hypothetical protein